MARLDWWHTKLCGIGSRKLVVLLRQEGYKVGRKLVRRLMQEMGLYTVYPKENLSKRNFKEAIVPYLLRNRQIQFSNEVWSVDITYVKLQKSHMYLTAIIDWHSHRAEYEQSMAKTFFSTVSAKYKDVPNVIYEIYNEPIADTWTDLKKYAQEVIGEIRKYDKDNVVLVGCPHWDQDIHLVAESPLEGLTNVMYTVHFYAATHGDDLRQRTEGAAKRGIPIFISESGATEASGDGKIDEESEEEWIKMCERLGISWVCWSISDKNESCSMLLPRATATGPWPDDVIKRYGKLVKGLLEKYNTK